YNLFDNYPTASELLIDHYIDLMGDYKEKEGRLILENLYRGFEIPERLFKNVKFEIYDGTKESEQYRLMEADWTVSQFEKYLKTSSCYKTFSSKNPNAEDPVNKFMSRIKKVGGWEDNQLLKVIGKNSYEQSEIWHSLESNVIVTSLLEALRSQQQQIQDQQLQQ
ncbi:13823_t:CDS:2, partial [Entrophospora sp. SA101]